MQESRRPALAWGWRAAAERAAGVTDVAGLVDERTGRPERFLAGPAGCLVGLARRDQVKAKDGEIHRWAQLISLEGHPV